MRIALLALAGLLSLQAQDQFFDSNGVSIRYVEKGQGVPVILVHGYQGSAERAWINRGSAYPALTAKYRVIAMDCRGHGKSGKPHDPKQYGPEMALDIVRLMDHLHIAKAHIVGYSMGAHITAKLLTMHPERFLTATLGGAPGRLGWTAEDDKRAETEASEMEQGINRSMSLRLSPKGAPPPTEAEMKARFERTMVGQDRLALAAVRRSNRDQSVTLEQMGVVRVPLLGIVGSRDPYLDGFQRLKAAAPKMKLVVVEGGSHGTTPETTEFRDTLLAFLAK